jgi:hypothetical protein
MTTTNEHVAMRMTCHNCVHLSGGGGCWLNMAGKKHKGKEFCRRWTPKEGWKIAGESVATQVRVSQWNYRTNSHRKLEVL